MQTKLKGLVLATTILLFLNLAACGGGGGGSSASSSTYSIGGTVSGLSTGGSVVLKDNGSDATTVSANGNFIFSAQLPAGSPYFVTVGTQPVAQSCTVTNAIGNVGAADVTNVQVACGTKEAVLNSFSGAYGANPEAGLVMDSSGNLYGTTFYGGTNNAGTVFKFTPSSYTETVLYSFTGGTDGRWPQTTLVMDSSGNLYGTTLYGGAYNYGTVFRVTPSGTETVVHAFTGGTDAVDPNGTLVMDSAGNLYGTTLSGGVHNDGTVFELTPSGTGSYAETVLYSFAGAPADAADPTGPLVMDSSGNLYGTTSYGITSSGSANGSGAVFKLTPSGTGSYTETVLYSFTGGADGGSPTGLVLDSSGNLCGTTFSGGANKDGAVFKLTPSGTGSYTETVVYSFAGGPADGENPYGSPVLDQAGNLYGTTYYGGASGNAAGATGGGTVFMVTPSGTEVVLHSFTGDIGGADGTAPQGNLIMDSAGNLYGITVGGGGGSSGTGGSGGGGTIFKIY